MFGEDGNTAACRAAAGAAGGPLRKAFAVLEALAEASEPVTLSELAKLLSLPKSTLHRQMRILTDLHLIVQTDTKGYELGDYLVRLAAASGPARERNVQDAVTPFLIELFERTRQIVSVALLSGTKVHHFGILYGHEHARLARVFRRPFPAHRSAAGRLLLAGGMRHAAEFAAIGPPEFPRRAAAGLRGDVERIRRTGLSYAQGEYIPELVEVAAAIHLGNTGPVAAIVVGGRRQDMNPTGVGRLLLDTIGSLERSSAADVLHGV